MTSSISRLFLVFLLVGIGNSRGAGEFATSHYRNLFVENGHSQPEVDAKINAAFQQLFHGDPEHAGGLFSLPALTPTGRSLMSATSAARTCAPRACPTA